MTEQQPHANTQTLTHPTKGTVTYDPTAWYYPGGGTVGVNETSRTSPDGNVEHFWLLASQDGDGTILLFDQDEWDAFVAGARAGEFDPETFDAADATITSNPNDESHETITVTET